LVSRGGKNDKKITQIYSVALVIAPRSSSSQKEEVSRTEMKFKNNHSKNLTTTITTLLTKNITT